MPIPEEQLKAWANQGATVGSANTYASIRKALNSHSWPEEMNYEVYLQGSYANSTNIRSESDVDVVIELTSVFWSNLQEIEKQSLGLTPGRYSLDDFRREVIQAIQSYYRRGLVDTSGGKAVKVLAESGRLNADVLPCATYKRYDSMKLIAEGITFWNQRNGQQVINYPKLHISNGEQKNSAEQTKGGYKPSLRMFKNARTRIIGDSEELRKRFPSYFTECLFFNVPDSVYLSSFQYTYQNAINYLSAAFSNGSAAKFVTQSGQYWLFGSTSVQWSQDQAADLVVRLNQLWENWYQ